MESRSWRPREATVDEPQGIAHWSVFGLVQTLGDLKSTDRNWPDSAFDHKHPRAPPRSATAGRGLSRLRKSLSNDKRSSRQRVCSSAYRDLLSQCLHGVSRQRADDDSCDSQEYFSCMRNSKQIFVDQLDEFAAGQAPILGAWIDAQASSRPLKYLQQRSARRLAEALI